jgi:hypothetical protein
MDPAWAQTHKFNCRDEHILLPISASMGVLGDFYATLIPCVLIPKLNLPRRQKLALYSLFLLGFLVVAAGIVRTYFINYVINETYDSTWYIWKFWIWTFVELYTSIIAASAPALKPFFRRFLVEPIVSKRGASSTYGPYHKTELREGREGHRGLWSNVRRSMPHADNSDLEKIGVVVGGDSTRKYELRTLPSGKVEPVQVNVGPQESLDLQSDSQASSLYPNEHNEWALPPTGRFDDGCPLRTYPTEIECPLPIPGPGRNPPVVEYASERRSVTPNRLTRSPSQCGHWTLIPRSSSLPTVQGGAKGGGSRDFAQHLSQGSVKTVRLRMESIRKADAEATAAHASQGPDDSDNEDGASKESSSDDALQLPMQRNIVSEDYDDNSLQLPRQGVGEDDEFRHSRVGLAL